MSTGQGRCATPDEGHAGAEAPSAIYIDAEATAFAWRDAAQAYFDAAGYTARPAFLGATVDINKSQFARSLLRDAEAADLVVLRFSAQPLERHWAFDAVQVLDVGGRNLVAVLDASNRWARRRLDARLRRPAFIARGPGDLEAILRAAVTLPPHL